MASDIAAPSSFWAKLKASGSFVKGLLLDSVIEKMDIQTPIGAELLECQVRESQTSGERYLVLKAQGGEATVFVPLDKNAAEQLIHFVEHSFLRKPAS